MRVNISLSDPGSQGSGFNLFNIFTDVDGYTTAVDTNISKTTLINGYTCSTIPDETNIIRIVSIDSPCMGVSQSINITNLFQGSRIYRNTSTNNMINATLLVQTNGGDINIPETQIYDYYSHNILLQAPTTTLEYNTYNINVNGLASLGIVGNVANININNLNWMIGNISFGIRTNGIVVTYTYPGTITLTPSNTISNPIYLNMIRTQI